MVNEAAVTAIKNVLHAEGVDDADESVCEYIAGLLEQEMDGDDSEGDLRDVILGLLCGLGCDESRANILVDRVVEAARFPPVLETEEEADEEEADDDDEEAVTVPVDASADGDRSGSVSDRHAGSRKIAIRGDSEKGDADVSTTAIETDAALHECGDMPVEVLNYLAGDQGFEVADQLMDDVVEPHLAGAEVESLLGMMLPERPSMLYTEAEALEASGVGDSVCRHFLEGSCLRADCPFRHDVGEIQCKYFALGACIRGDDCVFAHVGVTAPRDRAVGVAPQAPGPVDLNLHDFPSLPTPAMAMAPVVATVATSSGGVSTGAGGDGPDTVEALRRQYPWATEASIKAVVETMGPDKVLLADKDSVERSLCQYVASGFFQHRSPAPVSEVLPPVGSVLPRSKQLQLLREAPTLSDGDWVSTGEDLSSQYTDLRGEAISEAVARNQCYQAATDAYKAGDKALARELSRKGRSHDARMRTLNRTAGAAIFAARNSKWESSSKHRRDVQFIDLHGLHRHEALGALEASLEAARTRGRRWIAVITGTGRHSKVGKAAILPTIKQDLTEKGYPYVETSTDGHGGVLLVRL